MWKNIGQFKEAVGERATVSYSRKRTSKWMSSDSLTHIPKQPCGFHCGKQELHIHWCCVSGKETERQSGANDAVMQQSCVCAFKFHDPLFTAGAGWQGALVHTALNNWDCKVNVRRIVKDGSPPSAARASGSVSWPHTSKSPTSRLLEPLSVIFTVMFWKQLFDINYKDLN